MAFTNVFDNTFPADTQQAKLLGDDIRKLKVDLQERMAAISGLDAAKPDFSTDTQPSAWNGLLFFATDTGTVYQFSNPNWVPVSLSGVGTKRFVTTITNGTFTNADGHILSTLTIPAGNLNTSSLIHVGAGAWDNDGVSGTPAVRIYVNGTYSGVSKQTSQYGDYGMFDFRIFMASVTKAVFVDATATGLSIPNAGAYVPVAVSDVTTNDLVLTIRQHGTGVVQCEFGDGYFYGIVT